MQIIPRPTHFRSKTSFIRVGSERLKTTGNGQKLFNSRFKMFFWPTEETKKLEILLKSIQIQLYKNKEIFFWQILPKRHSGNKDLRKNQAYFEICNKKQPLHANDWLFCLRLLDQQPVKTKSKRQTKLQNFPHRHANLGKSCKLNVFLQGIFAKTATAIVFRKDNWTSCKTADIFHEK